MTNYSRGRAGFAHDAARFGVDINTREPTGPEWGAASADFQPFFEEAAAATYNLISWGCCISISEVKDHLDSDWTIRANSYLAQHGLEAEVCVYFTYTRDDRVRHIAVQFSKKPAAASTGTAPIRTITSLV
jgi:hypothetical protein